MVSPDCGVNDASVFRRRCRDNENAVFAKNFSPIRGAGKGSAHPVKDKAELLADLRKAAEILAA